MKSQIQTTDDELILQLKQGNRSAFSQIYKKYWQELYNNAYNRTRSREQCEDIVQNVLADLWLRRNDHKIDNLQAYLHSAVKFQFYKLISKQPKESVYLDYLDELLYSNVNADDALREKEIAKVIELWLATLPEKRRRIFLMRYSEEMSTRDIAKNLGISQNTVQAQLHTANQSLNTRLAQFLTVAAIIHVLLD
jgi:RNA polymerase sigma factor (sigma-70 family)